MSEYEIVKMKRKPVYRTADMARAGGVTASTVRSARQRGEIEVIFKARDAIYSEQELIKFAHNRQREIIFED